MEKYLIVSAGAASGGAARYWLSDYIFKIFIKIFPLCTLIVNLPDFITFKKQQQDN
jgi:fluoride ion exporter CrcB/FEX